MVIVDRFTKMIRLKATTINISLEGIAKIYRDEIWKLHGIPRKILSDRRLQFASKFMEEFTKALGTIKQLSTSIILKQMDKWRGLIRKWECFYNTMTTTNKMIGWNG